MALGKPLHLRLFLEGQEVPVISAQVQASMFAPATAAIQVVPLDEVLQLKPRTMVHLFFLEEPLVTSVRGQLVRQNLSGARTTNEKGEAQDTALSDHVYKLLFCGEIVGFSFVKTPMSRAVILQCLDHSNYWDLLQATMMDYGPQGNAFVNKASLYASNEYLFASIPGHSPAEKLRSWIMSKPQTPGLKDVAGLAGGILSMMEIMGGLRGYRLGVNDFFTIAELRNHMLAQVTAEDGDACSQRLLDHKVFFEWLNNNLSCGGGQLSLRDMFKLLCQYIYYAIVPCPVAKYEPTASNVKVNVPEQKGALSNSRYFPGIQEAGQNANLLLQTENQTKANLQRVLSDVKTKIIAVVPKIKGMPSEVSVKANLLQKQLDAFVANYDSLSVTEREVRRQTCQPLAQDLLSAIDQAGGKVVTSAGGTSYVAKQQDKLHTTIFRPDCFMSAPPTCNVIFPEQYTQLTYDRTFINEVTRVEIDVHSELAYGTQPRDPNKAQLTSLHLLQPDIHNFTSEVAKHLSNKWRILMDHELHTGIIAKEEWLPDSFSSGWLRKGNDTDAQKKMKLAQLTWSQKTGLHHFFKYRIGPRTMSVTGRFMPYLVAGFPAVVLQRPFYVDLPSSTEEQILQLIRSSANPAQGPLFAPPQFLGMIEAVTHSLGQDGGHTSLSLSHCRSHLGIDDEFVGVVLDRIRKDKSKKQLVRWTLTYKDAKDNERLRNFLRDCTPQDSAAPQQAALSSFNLRQSRQTSTTYEVKQISDGVESTVTKTVSVQALSEETRSPSGSGTLTSESPNQYGAAGETVQVPTPPGKITVGSKGLKGGVVKQVQVLPPYTFTDTGGSRYYNAILVVEEVQVPFDANTDPRVPVEYVVKPSWLSTSYDNENVGAKVYQKFFGCGSIVDQIITSDVGQIPPAIPDDGLNTTADEDVRALQARLKNIDQKRSLISIEVAVNFIAYLYGKVRSEHLDVEEFIESFTRRPVASKLDVLGSHDLDLTVSGTSVTAVSGTLGFHSLSVNAKTAKAGNLTGLLDNPVMRSAQMNSETKKVMSAAYDVRPLKVERVEEYIAALTTGNRGFVG